jgi:hypothetical protein
MAAIVFSALLVAAGARNATIVVVLTTVVIAGAALTVWGVVAFPSLRERLLWVYDLLGLSAGACTEKTAGEQEVDEH